MTENIGRGFRNADGDLFRELVHCLDFMNDLAFFKAYKSHSWQSLEIKHGDMVVDVGCGTGSDLIHHPINIAMRASLGSIEAIAFLALQRNEPRR